MRKFGVSLAPLVGIFRDVFGFLGRIIRSAAPAVQNLGIAIIAAFEPIRAFVRPILEALEPIIKRIFEKLAGFLESLIPRIKGLTPLFGTLGKFIGNLIGPLLGVGLGIKAINTAMKIGKGVKIFAEGLSLLSNGAKAGNLLKMSMAMQQMGASQGIAQRLSETFALLTGKMDLATAAANKNKLALIMQAAASIKAKIAVLAHAAAEKIRAIATKIAAVAQGILNAVMAANPIAIIILAVVALIAVIVLLVKNWDKVGPTIMGALKAVGNFFKMVWGTIVGFFKKVAQFIKANALKIVTILGLIFFTIPTLIALVVALIIKHWDKIKTAIIAVVTWVVDKVKQIWQNFADFMSALWEGIKNVAAVIWDGVKAVFLFVIDAVKAAWQGFSDFIAGLWEGIKIIASTVWNGITAIVSSVIETIKGLWQGFVDFFSGLFTWIGDMASGVWDRIKESFTAVFDGIKQKFLGFIEVIQTGWEKVKGFFGGIGEGVVNFFTGGDKDSGGSGGAAEKTASSTGTGSLAQTAAATAAARNTYNNGGNTQTINSSASINLTVPPGTSTQQAEFLTREVDRAVQESLASAIGGSRGAIPSPEARRN
jgi:phage-related protein